MLQIAARSRRILCVEILDDLFPALVFEVDVDVGWLVAVLADMKRSKSTSIRGRGRREVTPRQ